MVIKLQQRAVDAADAQNAELLIPHKLYRTKYLVIYVNKSWRLLSKDKGESWLLLIYHEFDRHI
ncbi:ParE family toxin-like protein [Enterobacter roggenkampii]|uniref:ParE family toxin-like protein n=1 Tax=Enterobacter roggenkampii TaxID=1812935 RepID=UPI003D68A093